VRVLVIGKFPPIEGGVSAQTYWFCNALAERGHQVDVVTDAAEVEEEYRIWLRRDDLKRLNTRYEGGGYVSVRWTRPWDDRVWRHIPAGNPRVTKLVGLAMEAVRSRSVDVIWSYYLEPYGFAASIVSAWTGVPFVLRHAGSDRFHLMGHPDMASCYREVFARTDALQAVNADYMGLGVPEEHMARTAGRAYIPREFAPEAAPMCIQEALDELRRAGWDGMTNDADPDLGKPIIGMYGKAGLSKGFGAVLDAVSAEPELRDAQVLLISGGRGLSAIRDRVESSRMRDRTWILPFVPHWRIPEFIRSCTVVCALENGFWIPQHSSSLPREIMACGTPLLLSQELAAKTADFGSHNYTCDPGNISELGRVLGHALRDDAAEALAYARTLQEALDKERASIADEYENALVKVASADGAVRSRTSVRRTESADGRREWLASQVPSIWDNEAGELSSICDREGTDAKEFLADAVGRVLTLAFGDTSAEVSSSEGSVRQLEASLLWMHSDCDGARGRAVFDYPQGAIPAYMSTNSKRTYVPVPGELCPLATSLLRFMRPHQEAAEMLYERMKQVAIARGENVPVLSLRARNDTWWLFVKSPALEGSIYTVDQRTKEILEACDGLTPATEIERSAFGDDTDRSVIKRTWKRLLSKNLIEFVWYP
jgi:glycosyltransferase involved in cell wall biosynthesis